MAKVVEKLVTKSVSLAQKTLAFSKPRLQTFWKYAKVEMRPPSPDEFDAVKAGAIKVIKTGVSGEWKNISTKDATRNVIVSLEVMLWFYIGEIIGKGSLIGYAIPGAFR
ncbi:hypothetical protein CHS0354_038625 [Potamilus streckersoni]|uniref:ATP synthase subunit g n=1 Tax=Potamilus streckersoni TaxID=2493646 RepID=A0AAE0TFT3_9BIVA|nr:hypothetical protein CHS0354_038625 [Potamilus streckersoni]